LTVGSALSAGISLAYLTFLATFCTVAFALRVIFLSSAFNFLPGTFFGGLAIFFTRRCTGGFLVKVALPLCPSHAFFSVSGSVAITNFGASVSSSEQVVVTGDSWWSIISTVGRISLSRLLPPSRLSNELSQPPKLFQSSSSLGTSEFIDSTDFFLINTSS